MGVFEAPANLTGHEQVVFCQDKNSGLKAIIAVYSTALGPALGGTRFYPYDNEEDAVRDALDLSKGMAYKASLAGLDLGGGKAVIWGDPVADKSEALLRAYGRFVESLGGRYITACDVGTYVQDMDVIAKNTRSSVGRSVENGGAGDSSVLTAYGVYSGHACSRRAPLGLGRSGRPAPSVLRASGRWGVTSSVTFSKRVRPWSPPTFRSKPALGCRPPTLRRPLSTTPMR